MTVPAKSKTWQYNVNQRTSNQANAVLDLKNVLKSFPLNPWTVTGSCDSVTAAMDGVDRWVTIANMVRPSASDTGVRSWIVLRQAAIGGGTFEVCISLRYSSLELVVAVSKAGFANNGTTSARPTAADEVVMSSGGGFEWASDTVGPLVIHGMETTDGKSTRLFLCRYGYVVSALFAEEPIGAPAGWTNPVLVIFPTSSSGTNNVISSAYLNTSNSHARAMYNSTGYATYLTCEGWNSLSAVNTVFQSEVLSAWQMFPVGLASESVGFRGYHGYLPDLYWVSANIPNGYSFPADGSNSWAVFSQLAFPWNGSIPSTSNG